MPDDPRFHAWEITPGIRLAWHEAWGEAAVRVRSDYPDTEHERFLSADDLDRLAVAARDAAAGIRALAPPP